MVNDQYQALFKWLSALVDNDLDVTGLSKDDVIELAVHLDGVADSAQGVTQELTRCLEQEASWDALETTVVNLQLEAEHAGAHWSKLQNLLSERGLWPDTTLDNDDE